MSIWFDILFLAKGIQVPTPSSTRVNSVFSTLVRLASQIVCWSICMFYYLKTLHGPLEGIILLVLMHKNVLTLVTLPSGVVLSYLLPICVLLLFWCSPTSSKPFNCLTLFFIDVLGITQRVTSLLKLFCSIWPIAESHFEVFWGTF